MFQAPFAPTLAHGSPGRYGAFHHEDETSVFIDLK